MQSEKMTATNKENSKFKIGQCKSLRIKCISEIGWFDTEKIISQVKVAVGMNASQWEIPWDLKISAGFSSLIDMESLDGKHHKFLLDTGWNKEYMNKAFEREGIDEMVRNGEVEFLFLSHEHMDHFWGLETLLSYNSELKIFVPDIFSSEALDFISGHNRILAKNAHIEDL